MLAWLWSDGKAFAVRIEGGDAPRMQMHPDQLPVFLATVTELVDQQFPQWQGLPITEVPSQGTVNALFRIGDTFVARFPLEPGDVTVTRRLLESEAQAARELSGRTRFLTTEPVALGEPGAGYPLPWAVQTWLLGVSDPVPVGGFELTYHPMAIPLSCGDTESTEGVPVVRFDRDVYRSRR